MEAHRSRRTRDRARMSWYAYYRQVRFARWLGSIAPIDDLIRGFRPGRSPALRSNGLQTSGVPLLLSERGRGLDPASRHPVYA
jgi:hypothetical protein